MPSTSPHNTILPLRFLLCVTLLWLAGCASQPRSSVPYRGAPGIGTPSTPSPAESSATLRQLVNEAALLQPLAESDVTRRFLAATSTLVPIAPRVAYINEVSREYYSKAMRAALPEASRAQLTEVQLDEFRYYYTKYGSPLAYVRALDFAVGQRINDLNGKRILDFGYGSIGQLRLLASLGAQVTGVDPDSYLAALYADPRDQGAVGGASWRTRGAVTLVQGFWPKEPKVVDQVGRGFDLILSKNTLKRGYIKPERKVDDKRQVIHLGVSDQQFLTAIFDTLAPGGRLVIYNLYPKPASAKEKYKPQADGRSPFSREQYEKAGLKVIAFDAEDHVAARKMGRLLKWDQNSKGEIVDDLDSNLFALVTIVARP